jgi:hypothetical protein
MGDLSLAAGALTHLGEAALGFVLGACIVCAMPRVIPSRWLIGLSLAGIGAVAVIGIFVYPLHERMLVLAAVLASYVLSGAALRLRHVRSRCGTEEQILLGLALLSMTVAGALFGYSLLAILAGLGTPIVTVLAIVGAVMICTGFILVVLFIERGEKGAIESRALIEAARSLEA